MSKSVTYSEMQKFITDNNGSFEPDLDHSNENFITEGFWDKDRENVLAYTRYYNDGRVCHFILIHKKGCE